MSDDRNLIIPHYHYYNSKFNFLYFHLYSLSFKTLSAAISHIPYERLVKVSGLITQNWIYKWLFILCPIQRCIPNINVSETKIFNFTPTVILTIMHPFHHHYDQPWEVWTSSKTFYLLFPCVTVGKSTLIFHHLPPIISLNDSHLHFISRTTTFARVSYTPWHQLVEVSRLTT